MGILIAIIVGAIAGWLAGELVKGEGFGLLANIVVGIIGGLVGQLLLSPLGIESTNIIGSILVATFGAAVLVIILRAISR
jgi:uncharacterized membrane protein YeaQ/YmgE (transglycosylase-associated protein family)